jgi:hypothetical protein
VSRLRQALRVHERLGDADLPALLGRLMTADNVRSQPVGWCYDCDVLLAVYECCCGVRMTLDMVEPHEQWHRTRARG